ncbi:divergent polysaccharide deacetylase family protein [Desulfovibrio sp. UCD-KL4C]|uniref:divergent polysaccharide deacetylase family protein n=1 Tax=Desulfovibrio sp. UCD-KL4C TaxID=2578120 RepID=UPI0025BD3D49|nr:divergent polysaccharide deacetylase family protein [Desulfovibrio sp. UCD-KL4C]
MEINNSDQNNKPEIPENDPGIRAYISKPLGIAVATIATASFICMIIAMLIFSDASSIAKHKESIPLEQQGFASENSTTPYEEIEQNDLEDLVKIADLALINELKLAEVSMSDLKLEDVILKKYHGRFFHFQQLRFPIKGNKLSFIKSIKNRLKSAGLSNSIQKIADDGWLLSINKVPTHKFFIDTVTQQKKTVKVTIDPNAPKMAIVIDDMGENVNLAQKLANLNIHITFSIWPNSSHAAEVARIGKKSKNEIMIHLPMEPKGYPKVHPGSDALLIGMNAKTIQQRVLDAIKKIPSAIGLNNHMGSRFTENLAGMQEVMIPLHQKKLFFLDSRTTAKSTARAAAKKAKVTLYERNIFLDNVKDISAIKFQLAKAAKIARKRGQSIAIGHPHPETIEAIRQWAKESNGKIRIVPVKKLTPHR